MGPLGGRARLPGARETRRRWSSRGSGGVGSVSQGVTCAGLLAEGPGHMEGALWGAVGCRSAADGGGLGPRSMPFPSTQIPRWKPARRSRNRSWSCSRNWSGNGWSPAASASPLAGHPPRSAGFHLGPLAPCMLGGAGAWALPWQNSPARGPLTGASRPCAPPPRRGAWLCETRRGSRKLVRERWGQRGSTGKRQESKRRGEKRGEAPGQILHCPDPRSPHTYHRLTGVGAAVERPPMGPDVLGSIPVRAPAQVVPPQ